MTTESRPNAGAVILVVPCFNEAQRLDIDAFVAATEITESLSFVFVDDGSTDATRAVLEKACSDHPQLGTVVGLDVNQGKAEAVRQGVLTALRSEPEFFGYWDADLATPFTELPRFLEVLFTRADIELVMGSRVNLLGRHVTRRLHRHYLGRIFATLVATALHLPVYDSQCGAKVFRSTPVVHRLFDEPFFAGWIFDAELLARAMDRDDIDGPSHVRDTTFELPLLEWSDVEGSALRARHLVTAARDSVRIYGRHTVRARYHQGAGGLTAKVVGAVRGVFRSVTIEGERVSTASKLGRVLIAVPTMGVFVLWTRFRAWLSGPVTYESTARDGTRFLCCLPDLIQSYIFLFGVWEPDLTSYIRRRLDPGRTFIDVGANIGYHSMVAAGAATSTGRVISIEASPAICAHLLDNLALNDLIGNVEVVNKAASDHHGELTIYRGPGHNTGLTTSVAERGYPAESAVECAPLHALLDDDAIDSAQLVKIDVEGAEGAVLAGMTEFVDRAGDDLEILVELSPKWWADQSQTPSEILAPLFERGFNAYEIDNNLWPWRYLWPDAVRPARRTTRNFDRKPRRIDLVLSRVDAAKL